MGECDRRFVSNFVLNFHIYLECTQLSEACMQLSSLLRTSTKIDPWATQEIKSLSRCDVHSLLLLNWYREACMHKGRSPRQLGEFFWVFFMSYRIGLLNLRGSPWQIEVEQGLIKMLLLVMTRKWLSLGGVLIGYRQDPVSLQFFLSFF